MQRRRPRKRSSLLHHPGYRFAVRLALGPIVQKSMELCIVQEFADGGDLANEIERLTKGRRYMDEALIWTYSIQALEGLAHLHKLGILHRDLKPANMMLCLDGTLKLGDLNVSKLAKFSLVKTQIGTPYYMSPEIWNQQPYGERSDMWALGCVMYEMAALRPPFRGRNVEELAKRVQAGYFPRIPAHYSKELESTIALLLRKSPQQRPTAEGLLGSAVIKAKRAELKRWMDETRKVRPVLCVSESASGGPPMLPWCKLVIACASAAVWDGCVCCCAACSRNGRWERLVGHDRPSDAREPFEPRGDPAALPAIPPARCLVQALVWDVYAR